MSSPIDGITEKPNPDIQNWKVRKEAYEDAKAQFEKTPDESHPVFVPFIQDPGLFKGAVADSNVAAQSEGLAAYCAFLKFGGSQACTRCVNPRSQSRRSSWSTLNPLTTFPFTGPAHIQLVHLLKKVSHLHDRPVKLAPRKLFYYVSKWTRPMR